MPKKHTTPTYVQSNQKRLNESCDSPRLTKAPEMALIKNTLEREKRSAMVRMAKIQKTGFGRY